MSTTPDVYRVIRGLELREQDRLGGGNITDISPESIQYRLNILIGLEMNLLAATGSAISVRRRGMINRNSMC